MRFGAGRCRDWSGLCSEVKTDERGRSAPGSTASATTSPPSDAPVEARAVILADKLHNL